MPTTCWIVHQPDEVGDGIVVDSRNRVLMFRSAEDALSTIVLCRYDRRGFIAQQLPDAEAFANAVRMDGQEAVWYGETPC